jgi:hypothetical protein
MENRQNLPAFRTILTFALLLLAIGGIGLALLFSLTTPTLGPRWLLFFLVTFAAAGLFLPVAFFLNLRFPTTPQAGSGVLLREALFFGGYCDLLLWLQLGGVLNFAMGTFILMGFVAIELIIRLRERSTWNPQA